MRTESYSRVHADPSEVTIKPSTYSVTPAVVKAGWKRSLSNCEVCSPKAAKHGNAESNIMALDGPLISLARHYLFALDRQALKKYRMESAESNVYPLIGNSLIIRSLCFRIAKNPSRNNRLNSLNGSASTPPRTSTYSRGNLNGADSNPMFPGELDSINPKSNYMNEYRTAVVLASC